MQEFNRGIFDYLIVTDDSMDVTRKNKGSSRKAIDTAAAVAEGDAGGGRTAISVSSSVLLEDIDDDDDNDDDDDDEEDDGVDAMDEKEEEEEEEVGVAFVAVQLFVLMVSVDAQPVTKSDVLQTRRPPDFTDSFSASALLHSESVEKGDLPVYHHQQIKQSALTVRSSRRPPFFYRSSKWLNFFFSVAMNDVRRYTVMLLPQRVVVLM